MKSEPIVLLSPVATDPTQPIVSTPQQPKSEDTDCLVTMATDPTHIITDAMSKEEGRGGEGEDWDDDGIEEMLQNEDALKMFDSICQENEEEKHKPTNKQPSNEVIEIMDNENEEKWRRGFDPEYRDEDGDIEIYYDYSPTEDLKLLGDPWGYSQYSNNSTGPEFNGEESSNEDEENDVFVVETDKGNIIYLTLLFNIIIVLSLLGDVPPPSRDHIDKLKDSFGHSNFKP